MTPLQLKQLDETRLHEHTKGRGRGYDGPRTSREHFYEAVLTARIRSLTTGKTHAVMLKWEQGRGKEDWFVVAEGTEEKVIRAEIGGPSFLCFAPITPDEGAEWLRSTTNEVKGEMK